MPDLYVHENDKVHEFEVRLGVNLLEILTRKGFHINNPCGGKGTCGKCKVKVKGNNSIIDKKETELLNKSLIEENIRLACYTKIEGELHVYLLDNSKKAAIMTDSSVEDVELAPNIKKEYLIIGEVTVEEHLSDIDRIKNSLPLNTNKNISLDLLRKISKVFNADKTDITLVSYNNFLIDIEKGNTNNALYGIGIDIGTTTIAAYLVNLKTGITEDIYSCLNSQKAYGDDVISRINYTIENEDGIKIMMDSIIKDINNIIYKITTARGIDLNSIYNVILAGNTTMIHMAMGLDCKKISISPFIPVTTDLHEFTAKMLNININPNGIVSFLPCVSAYIGADTLCAALASKMNQNEVIKLLVDIGTNGEIALGSKNKMYACSVAAGPAFEGAHLKNGIGGVEGAIDKVLLTKDIYYTTIGNASPIGICGSGIVDIISELLKKGIIDKTGRILDNDEFPMDLEDLFIKRVVEINGMKAFLLYKSENEENNIYVTQKDIREIQNAKAAILAGIKVLIKKSGINISDISKVYLAGGFGSYINIESALNIGLLPKELAGKIASIGNAAGAGTVQVLKSINSYMRLEKIKDTIQYIELSNDDEFTDLYISSMMLD